MCEGLAVNIKLYKSHLIRILFIKLGNKDLIFLSISAGVGLTFYLKQNCLESTIL